MTKIKNVIQGIDMSKDGIIKLTLKLDSSCFETGVKEVLDATIAAYKWAVKGDNAKDLASAVDGVNMTTTEIVDDMLSGGLRLYQKISTYEKNPGATEFDGEDG